MKTSFGNVVVVGSLEAFEGLTANPASLSGWFDPATQYGIVTFPTVSAALAARRET